MQAIQLPRPDNVRGRFGSFVTSDVFHIAERIQEIDKRLFIQSLDPPVVYGDKTWNFAIVEVGPDGVERLVYRTEELDARIISKLEYLLKVPFEQRFAEAERLEVKADAERKENALNELYENMGGNMYTQLERCGFIQRPRSYAKTNRTARRARKYHPNSQVLIA